MCLESPEGFCSKGKFVPRNRLCVLPMMRRMVFPLVMGTVLTAVLCAQPCIVRGDREPLVALETYAGALPESLQAAARGLDAAPHSGRLYLLKSEALERQGRYFEARQTLRSAAGSVNDAALLARLAEMEDVSGRAASQAYKDLYLVRQKNAPNSPEAIRALERGFEVAVRDGDRDAASFFNTRLRASGNAGFSVWLTQRARRSAGANVPGGLDALAFIAHGHSGPPQLFFAEYCRTVLNFTTSSNATERNRYLESIRNYFQRLAALEAMANRKGNDAEIVISVADRQTLQRSEKTLGILGWKLRVEKGAVRLEAGEKSAQANRQETASALALDEVGLQQALQARQKFAFEIKDETAPVLLGEPLWMNTFFPKAKFNGGLAEAITTDLRVARVYAALSTMSDRAVSALTAGSDLKTLVEKRADLLYRYGAAFALRSDRAAVPGGLPAEPVWEKLVGIAPTHPNRFFHALLEKDDGRLLAFFATLGEVDTIHQRFFTRSAARIQRFYELFRDSMDLARGAVKQTRNSSFAEFLQEMPVDSEMHVLFPGGPEVWQLAKGNSSSVSRAAKMVRKLSRITAPEQEDQILIRLAKTRYKDALAQQKVSELDHFLAVVRIDSHRDTPLDESSALLLAQNYGLDKPVYPYFAMLTGLEEPHFQHFFEMVEQLRARPPLEINVPMGEIHSLIELISLLQQSGALDPKSAAALFDQVCVNFRKADTAAGYTAASLETVRSLLKELGARAAAGGADDVIQRKLIGEGGRVSFVLGGVPHEMDWCAARRSAFQKVLAEQRVTALQTLLDFYGHLQDLTQRQGSAIGHGNALDRLRGQLLSVELPKGGRSSLSGKIVLQFDQARIAELTARLKQRLAKKKVNPRDVEQLCGALQAAICPQVELALSGIVYAYFLSPDDLLVSQDPLLLRKHRFVTVDELFPASDLQTTAEGLGSLLQGGFADFPTAAGKVAFSGAEPPPNTADLAVAQMAAFRATDWNRLGERDLLAFGLRLRIAREWILHAGADGQLMLALQEDTAGLLSPARQGELLDAIAVHDWEAAFRAVTLGDLYALSEKYLLRYSAAPWPSPVAAALRRISSEADSTRLRWLGPSAPDLLGCSHPHLQTAGPYEQYEWLLFPAKLAQRSAEFKFYVADFAGRIGIPPAVLNVIGQPIALQMVRRMHMADLRDWRGAQLAFGNLNEAAFSQVK